MIAGAVTEKQIDCPAATPSCAHPDGRVAIVPRHGTVKRGTLSSILRQAGITPSEFLDLVK